MVKQLKAAGKYVPIICVMLIWGSMGIASKGALAEFSTMEILCLRSGIGAAALFPFARRKQLLPARGERWKLAVLAIIGVVLCNFFYSFHLHLVALMFQALQLSPFVICFLQFSHFVLDF